MGVDFKAGMGSYTVFEGQESSSFLHVTGPKKAAKALKDCAGYVESDSGSIQQDQNVLNQCDNDARRTNDFYVGGKLEYYMDEWIQKTKDYKNIKNRINPNQIGADLQKYNDNLETAKCEKIRKELVKQVEAWNSQQVPKERYCYRERKVYRGTYNGYPVYDWVTDQSRYLCGKPTDSGWQELMPPSGWWEGEPTKFDEVSIDNGPWKQFRDIKNKRMCKDMRQRTGYEPNIPTRPDDSYNR